MFLVPFAEAALDPITGGAGWVGTTLLSGVLGWVFYKLLPAKDKQLTDQLAAKDAQVMELLKSKDTQLVELLTSKDKQLTEQLKLERDACESRHVENLTEWRLERDIREKRHAELMVEFRRTHDEEKELRHAVAGLTQTVMLWVAVVRQVTGIEERAVVSGIPRPTDTGSGT